MSIPFQTIARRRAAAGRRMAQTSYTAPMARRLSGQYRWLESMAPILNIYHGILELQKRKVKHGCGHSLTSLGQALWLDGKIPDQPYMKWSLLVGAAEYALAEKKEVMRVILDAMGRTARHGFRQPWTTTISGRSLLSQKSGEPLDVKYVRKILAMAVVLYGDELAAALLKKKIPPRHLFGAEMGHDAEWHAQADAQIQKARKATGITREQVG